MAGRTLLISLIMLTFTAVVAAQGPRALVFFSGDPACGYKNRSVPTGSEFRCSSVSTPRGPVSTITHRGVSLSVAFLEGDGYNMVGAAISNGGDKPVVFDTDSWGGAHFKKRSDYYERKSPVVAELSIPTRDIMRGLALGVKYENSLDTFMAEGARTTEAREVRRPDGTRYRVQTTVPDKEAVEQAARQNGARSELAAAQQRQLRETALTAKSVPGGGTVKGLVYFRKLKDIELSVYSIEVDGITYVFVLPYTKK